MTAAGSGGDGRGESTAGGSVESPAEAIFRATWAFYRSVPALEFLPDADRPEVAFAGRSNVGKSTLINALVDQRGLARASNTPGRTQELNFFRPTLARHLFYLVDMPGYGFAKAPKAIVEAWTALIKDYLRGRPTLARVFLLIDARHGVKAVDETIMALLDEAAVAFQVVLTKTDKLSPPALARMIAATQECLAGHPAAMPAVLATSADRKQGLGELREAIAIAVGATPA